MLKFGFKLSLYKEIFDSSIYRLLKIENIKLSFILKEDKGKNGIDFEDIIVEYFWNNAFDFIKFPEKNKLIVKNIYDLKNNDDKSLNVEEGQPIIIRQKDFVGKYYDVLIIINYKGQNYAIFIQIGLSKKGTDINTYFQNLISNSEKYKNGVGKLINNKIDELGFLLIFDYSKQITLRNKNNNCDGVGFCLQNNIEFLICKNFKLYYDLDSQNSINSFIITEQMKIHEKTSLSIVETIKNKFINLCNKISFERKCSPKVNLTDEEKNKIITYANKIYSEQYTNLDFSINYDEESKNFEAFSILDNDKSFGIINIFQENKTKYLCLNNELLKFNEKKISKVKKEEKNSLNNKGKCWDVYFLQKKRKIENK